jgi:uncharacterized metal-binding protein YceD (DUF177 family)
LHHFKIKKLKSDNQYIIRFKGLNEGNHNFRFEVKSNFFIEFNAIEAKDGNLEVIINLNKKLNFLTLNILIKGTLSVQCDRCLEYFNYPIEYKDNLLVKFSESFVEQSGDIIILHPSDSELDLKHYIFECISLSIPYRKIHPKFKDGKSLCKKEMLQKFHELEAKEQEKIITTNWEKLKYFFENNN